MPSSHLKNFLTHSAQRLLARVLGSVVTDCEVDAAIGEAEYLDRIEETARRYDAEDKPHLAERLRRRALALTCREADHSDLSALPGSAEPQALPATTTRRRRSKRGEDA